MSVTLTLTPLPNYIFRRESIPPCTELYNTSPVCRKKVYKLYILQSVLTMRVVMMVIIFDSQGFCSHVPWKRELLRLSGCEDELFHNTRLTLLSSTFARLSFFFFFPHPCFWRALQGGEVEPCFGPPPFISFDAWKILSKMAK